MSYLTATECRKIVEQNGLVEYVDSIRKNLNFSSQNYNFAFPTNQRAAFVESHFTFDDLQLTIGMNVSAKNPAKKIYVEISAIKKSEHGRLQLQSFCKRYPGIFTQIKDGQRDYVRLVDFQSLMPDTIQIERAVAQAYKFIAS